jgi:hypothetical protein
MSIHAELHDKMPFIYSEDILTSDVFTAFRYLPAGMGIIGFLRTVEGLAGLIEAPDESSSCAIYFWPRGSTKEPDVLLELAIGGRLYHVVVEAKYRSGASNTEDELDEEGKSIRTIGNQLAAEFRELQQGSYRVRVGGSSWHELRLASAPNDRALLYLTAHQTPPQREIAKFAEYHPQSTDKLSWASWYDVYEYLAGSAELRSRSPYCEIVEDLLALLRKKSFCPLLAVPQPPLVQPGSLPEYRWLG